MGDVSDHTAPEYAPADLQVIMNGGANWMARMTAFLDAQEKAQAAMSQAQITGDIVARLDEARRDREAAFKELASAKEESARLVEEAKKQAAEALNAARIDAKRLVDEANSQAAHADEQAKRSLEEAQAKMAEAQSVMSRSTQRAADLDALSANLDKRAAEIDAALAEAAAKKEHYQAFADKLLAIIADEKHPPRHKSKDMNHV